MELKQVGLEYLSYFLSFIILIFPFFYRKKRDPGFLSGVVMSLGVLGTFIGIFIGLLWFNTGNIEASVPDLLSGLKIAFLTSIVGMFTGFILKMFPGLYGFDTSIKTEGAGIDDIVDHLKAISEGINSGTKRHEKLLINIEKALAGEGDSTLLTQMQKMRTSFSDKQDLMIKEFKSFAETMAENNSSALIDALTLVMKDFNAKINEQFGENFKHLNEAVGSMVIWQQNYKEHVEKLTANFEILVMGYQKSEQTLETIVDNSQKFSGIAENLEKTMNMMSQQMKFLNEGLKAFSEMASDAGKAMPAIEENLNALTKGFAENAAKVIDDSGNFISDITKKWDELFINLEERLGNQVDILDKALEQELTKALSSMGGQLASLSRQFAEDYGPLTRELGRIVEIAKNIES